MKARVRWELNALLGTAGIRECAVAAEEHLPCAQQPGCPGGTGLPWGHWAVPVSHGYKVTDGYRVTDAVIGSQLHPRDRVPDADGAKCQQLSGLSVI